MRAVLGLSSLAGLTAALPQQQSSPSGATTTSAASSTSVSTAIPSPTEALSSPLQNFTPPETQSWCTAPGSRIYCPGELLQTVQLAAIYPDSKTFVDKPTTASENEVVQAFYADVKGKTVQDLVSWVDKYFSGEGLDIVAINLTNFDPNPSFLNYVQDVTLRGWLKQVHSYWKDLIRVNVPSTTGVSSLIPQSRPFVVPGGRFRESYYWDTYFILEGLLTGGLYDQANNTIQSFLDTIEKFGFIPNGGRIYYKNRSQPPLFTQMLHNYVQATNDTSFLKRAVQLCDREMQWWDRNSSINVTSPSGNTHSVHRYAVTINTAPRAESYLEDWETVNGPLAGPRLNISTELYSDIASGAESGMDYSLARWGKEPLAFPNDTTAGLRSLNVNEQIPVDLQSILYRNYQIISDYYTQVGNDTRSAYYSGRAQDTRAAIIDLHWNSSALVFRDYNLTANAQASRWFLASYWPYFSGIIPDEVLANETTAQKAFSGLSYITANYNGSIPASLLPTGQQWDFPNAWPPHIYVAVAALRALPSNLTSRPFQNFGQESLQFSYVPSQQFGVSEQDLPPQSVLGNDAVTASAVQSFGGNGNVGNLTGLGWADGLATAIASRYQSAAFCSWYATGGSIPGVLAQLSQQDLNATNSVGNTGAMFEKFNALDLDQAGQGGEYTVQAGFGWTNGVAIWLGRNYGSRLQAPSCPGIEADTKQATGVMSMHREMHLRPNLV